MGDQGKVGKFNYQNVHNLGLYLITANYKKLHYKRNLKTLFKELLIWIPLVCKDVIYIIFIFYWLPKDTTKNQKYAFMGMVLA